MNRRDFIQRVEGLSAGALALSLTGCTGFYYVNAELRGRRLLIPKAEFAKGRFVLVDAPGFQLPLYVYRQDDGAFSAVSTKCMHRGCQVEPGGDHLVCPCHGSEYTNTGDVLKGPTEHPLQRFPVTVEDDRVIVELPAGEERDG
ncbi:MAG: ubiquinol-cytochrome c reductase iron-sulfur subunit [Gemmatimonadales bacterium]